MKYKMFLLLLSVIAVTGCEREGSGVPTLNALTGSVCKRNDLKSSNDQSTNQDCIQYSWVSGDTLLIKHINAAFNCCPDGFRAELKVVGDTLVITEHENSSLCDCSCLFDLTCKISGVDKKTWWIRIEEPYVRESDLEKIVFKAELRKNVTGEYCVTRRGYPWGL